MGPQLARRWPAIRAVLIALAIVISLLSGCPIPEVPAARLDAPVNRHEIALWADRLGRSPEDLRTDLIETITRLRHLHGTAMTPFDGWFDTTGTHQRWNLFPVADPDPVWMHVETQRRDEAPGWTLRYRPNDPDHDWLADELEYRRLRGAWNPGVGGPRTAYGPFVAWLAREAFAADPEVVAVRVRMRQLHVRDPGAGTPALEITDEYLWEAVRHR
jgi:hypothetical protein